MSVTLKDNDHGYNALVKAAFANRKPVLEVGVLDGDRPHGDSGATVLDVAMWNEFGTATIPERSFIRAWFDQAEPRLRSQLVTLMQSVIAGKRTPEQVLELLGMQAVGGIQERMAGGVPPPNAPSTVAKKGSSTPLVDSGQLRASITYRVTEDR